jgi:hypothetical protein
MSLFLIRDDGNGNGFVIRQGPLARTRQESYVPWALTNAGQVVYARSDNYRSKPAKSNLKPYTAQVSKERRAQCQSMLGMMALDHQDLTARAVGKVSAKVREFLLQALVGDEKIMADYAAMVGKYAYGLSYMSFGRFSDKAPKGAIADRVMWMDALAALDSGKPLAGVMNIHDNVGSKLVAKYDPGLGVKYKKWANQFRASDPGELFYDDTVTDKNPGPLLPGRGRAANPRGSYKPSTTGGMTSEGTAGPSFKGKVQLHNRGVDMYRRSAPRYSQSAPLHTAPNRGKFSSVGYYRDLDTRNELFGAGPSGTTGTLLAAAMTFGDLSGEDLKQYCLAIIGYLVGGGCHSLHESLTVMGYHPELQYNSSSLLAYQPQSDILKTAESNTFPILPVIFTNHPKFKKWRDEFYDIVVLGGIHWMFG